MNLLDFTIPAFTQMNFVDANAKTIWNHKIEQAKKLIWEIERESVIHGLRLCLTDSIHCDKLDEVMLDLAIEGLIFLPITKISGHDGFSTQHMPVADPNNFYYYGVIAQDMATAEEFSEAEKSGNHQRTGELLGYPACCVHSFCDLWEKQIMDHTWHQAGRVCPPSLDRLLSIKIDPMNNGVFRSSLRVAPFIHIPCAFDCGHTKDMADQWMQLAKELGKEEAIQSMIDILSLPWQWDCSKGIAVITTPVFKITTNSLPTADRYIVQCESDYYPQEAPSGLVFPWKNKKC